MDLFAALVALGRRWYLTIVMLALVLGGTLYAAQKVKPDYKASASVILLAPTQPAVTNPANLGSANPYLNAGPGTFATVLSRVLTSDATGNQVAGEGGTRNYDVGQGVSNSGPIINITVTDSSPSRATKTAGIVIALIKENAVQLQSAAKAPPKSFITVETVVSGDKPVALRGSRTRIAVAVTAMGIVITFVVVLLVDAALVRRKRRRRDRERGQRTSLPTRSENETNGRVADQADQADQDVPLSSAGS